MEDASGGLIPRTPNCNLNNDDDSVIDGHHSNSQTGFKLKLPAGSTLGFTLIFTGKKIWASNSYCTEFQGTSSQQLHLSTIHNERGLSSKDNFEINNNQGTIVFSIALIK